MYCCGEDFHDGQGVFQDMIRKYKGFEFGGQAQLVVDC